MFDRYIICKSVYLQLLLCPTTYIIIFHNKTCHQLSIIYTCTCISYIHFVLLYYLYIHINVRYNTFLALQSHITFLLIYNNHCHIYFIYVLAYTYMYYIYNVSLLTHPGDPTRWKKLSVTSNLIYSRILL